MTDYYVIITSLLLVKSLLRHYYSNNGSIITVIMGLLFFINTESIMGNNESIITHYEPTQLADDLIQIDMSEYSSHMHRYEHDLEIGDGALRWCTVSW